MAVATLQCPWCRLWSTIAFPRLNCPNCGHRIDVATRFCDCVVCKIRRQAELPGEINEQQTVERRMDA
jgi:hypothetical protein